MKSQKVRTTKDGEKVRNMGRIWIDKNTIIKTCKTMTSPSKREDFIVEALDFGKNR